ncbi:MAG: bifunctional nuclease domain-containing protein [Candidatus Binatia bacterium]
MIHLTHGCGWRVWPLLLLALGVAAACRQPPPREIEVDVRGVGFDDPAHGPVVILQDHDRRVALPIWVGAAEARAIAMQLRGITPPRPLTHDLVKEILDGAGVELRKVVITDLRESTYYAQVFLHARGREWHVDSRPSDAIALAVRCHRPIYVARALLQGEGSIDLTRHMPAASTARFAGITVQNLTAEMSAYFNVPPGRGAIVADVGANATADLRRGDVILELDGKTVTGVGDLERRMRAVPEGASARLSVQRGSQRIPVQFAASGYSP